MISALKKSVLVCLVLVFIAFSHVSCDLEGDSNYTPQINFLTYPLLQNGDTLQISAISGTNELLLDTIHVGDTVSFKLFLNGYTNKLQSFYILQSADSVSRVLLPQKVSLDSVFTAASDYKNGKFLFKDNISALFFSFNFVAKAVTKESKFSIHLVSDAKFDIGMGGTNTALFNLKTPIKAAVTVE